MKRLHQTVGEEATSTDYIMFSRRLEIPEHALSRDTEHRVGDTTRLVIAFPALESPPPQSIYAFLPVCPSAFSFAICADWSLTSSRQAVHSDSPLNLWLRDEVAITFGEAVTAVPAIREHVGRYIPVDQGTSSQHSFWAPIATQLRTVLRDRACIKTEGGNWRRPEDVLIRVPECTAELISNDSLAAHCGKEFVSAAQLRSIGTEKALGLGCRKFELGDLLQCLRAEEFVATLTAAPNSYYDDLYQYLHATVGMEESERIYTLPIFRVFRPKNDVLVTELAALCDGPIFQSLPECWQGVIHTRAVRVLCAVPVSVAALQFVASANILPATLEGVVQSISDQHLHGQFASRSEVWHGLRFLKEHYHELESAESWQEQLRLSLVVPAHCGALMSMCDLSCPAFLGLHCPQCFPEGVPARALAEGGLEKRPKLLPVRMQSAVDHTHSNALLEIGTSILESGSSAHIVTKLRSKDPAKAQAAVGSEGVLRGIVRFDVTVLDASVGVGFATEEAQSCDAYTALPSRRPGSVVLFGDGCAWLGSEAAEGTQRFGAGDVLSVACDAEEGIVFLAVNGKLLPGPSVRHSGPSAVEPLDQPMGMKVPEEMVGGKLLPFVVMEQGGQCEVSFSHCFAAPELDDLGAVALAAYQAANIKARCTRSELSIDLAGALEIDESTTEEMLAWEAFFLAMGADPHLSTCSSPGFWNGLVDGTCPICFAPFLPDSPAVSVASCEHKFHSHCINQWLHRKSTCPVCRGPAKAAELRPIKDNGITQRLSASISRSLGKLALMPDGARGRGLLLRALEGYSSQRLTKSILAASSIATTQGPRPLSRTFLSSAFKRFADSNLPYLDISGEERLAEDMSSVLGSLGVASALNVDGIVKALAVLGQAVANRDGPAMESRLTLFAGLYGQLDSLMRTNTSAEADVRCRFRASALVYVGGDTLKNAEQVLWSCNDGAVAKILQKPVISHLYPSLRIFFQETLGVSDIDLDQCVQCLRSIARPEWRATRLDTSMTLAQSFELVLQEIESTQFHGQGFNAAPELAELLDRQSFPLLCDGRDPTQGWRVVPRDHTVRDCRDCMLFYHSGPIIRALTEEAETNGRVDTMWAGGRACMLHETLDKAPNLAALLLSRRLIYSLEESISVQRTVSDPQETLLWAGWCKDYLNLRYLVDLTRMPESRKRLDSTSLSLMERRQQEDPWAVHMCTAQRGELRQRVSITGLMERLTVNKCSAIELDYEFCGATTELGCAQHEAIRSSIAFSGRKSLGFEVRTSGVGWSNTGWCSSIDQHECASDGDEGTVINALSNAGTLDEDSLDHVASGLAVLWRIIRIHWEEREGAHWVENWKCLDAEMLERSAARAFLRHRLSEFLQDDEEERNESGAESLPEVQEERRSEPEPEPEPVPEPEPEPEGQDCAGPGRDAENALLLDCAIATSPTPWALPRGPPQQADSAGSLPPAMRSQEKLEAAAYGWMSHHLPEFGPGCWVSKHRDAFFPSQQGNRDRSDLGFSFQYNDTQGLLTDGLPARALIGVKGDPASFELTPAEREAMQRCAAQTNAARAPDALPTLFVLLHLEGSADDDTTVRVGRAISNPGGQLGGALDTEIIGYRARWA